MTCLLDSTVLTLHSCEMAKTSKKLYHCQQQQYLFAKMAGNQKGQLPIKAGCFSEFIVNIQPGWIQGVTGVTSQPPP